MGAVPGRSRRGRRVAGRSRRLGNNSFGRKTLDELDKYTASQQCSLPIIYGAHYYQHVPVAWQGVTWGLVEGFVKWLLNQGYSLASINNRLSAVKVYVRLAAKAASSLWPNMPSFAGAWIRQHRRKTCQ